MGYLWAFFPRFNISVGLRCRWDIILFLSGSSGHSLEDEVVGRGVFLGGLRERKGYMGTCCWGLIVFRSFGLLRDYESKMISEPCLPSVTSVVRWLWGAFCVEKHFCISFWWRESLRRYDLQYWEPGRLRWQISSCSFCVIIEADVFSRDPTIPRSPVSLLGRLHVIQSPFEIIGSDERQLQSLLHCAETWPLPPLPNGIWHQREPYRWCWRRNCIKCDSTDFVLDDELVRTQLKVSIQDCLLRWALWVNKSVEARSTHDASEAETLRWAAAGRGRDLLVFPQMYSLASWYQGVILSAGQSTPSPPGIKESYNLRGGF